MLIWYASPWSAGYSHTLGAVRVCTLTCLCSRCHTNLNLPNVPAYKISSCMLFSGQRGKSDKPPWPSMDARPYMLLRRNRPRCSHGHDCLSGLHCCCEFGRLWLGLCAMQGSAPVRLQGVRCSSHHTAQPIKISLHTAKRWRRPRHRSRACWV
eukprot:349620-Chlamydomonas_euryale.AAC.3